LALERGIVLGGTPVLNAMSAWMIYWCVGNSTDKDNLWGTSMRRFGSLLGSNVNLGISMNGRKALKVEVFVKTTELKKMVESRPHVSTERSLLVSTTLGERLVERILLFNGNTEVDCTDSKHVEFLLLASSARHKSQPVVFWLVVNYRGIKCHRGIMTMI
jgi:hypothetical protein